MSKFRPITEDEPTEETPSIFGDSEAPFPLAALPPGIRAFTDAIAQQNEVPVELAAATTLAVVSAAAGAGIRLASGRGRTLAPNLYFLIGARSGLGKSITYQQAAEPILEDQQCRIEAWKREKEDAPGEPPPFPSLILSNATSEAVARALSVNPGNAAALMTPDARGAISILEGRYAKGGGMDIDLLLNAFSGDSMHYARTGSECFSIRSPRLTVFLAVQPDKLTSLCAREEFIESGLAARFLMVRCAGERCEDEDSPEVPGEIAEQWKDIVEGALALKTADAATIELAPEAVPIRRAIRSEQRSLLKLNRAPALDTTISRLEEQSQRLALNLHIARNGRRAPEFPVAAEDMAGGVAIARWFLPRGAELLAPATSAAIEKDRQRLHRAFGEIGGNEITLRILRSHRGIFEETVERLAAAYPSEFRIHTRKHPQGGRPSQVVALIR